MNTDDPNSLTMDKLLDAMKKVESIPRYELQLAPGQVGRFKLAWDKATMPFGRTEPDPLDFKSAMFHSLPLGGIPVVTDEYMPPGVGVLVQKRLGGISDLMFILYFSDGELKVMKVNPPENWPAYDLSLMPKVVT